MQRFFLFNKNKREKNGRKSCAERKKSTEHPFALYAHMISILISLINSMVLQFLLFSIIIYDSIEYSDKLAQHMKELKNTNENIM